MTSLDPGIDSTEALVTVVIPTFNRCMDVARALDNLAGQSGAPLKAIVVDNSSNDGTADMVAGRQAAWRGRLAYLRKAPQGPASARQVGVMAADTPFVLFHDSDVELGPDWVSRALGRLVSSPDIAAIGGHIVYAFEPGRVNAYGGELNWFGLAWDVDEGHLLDDATTSADRIWINCSAMLTRRNDVVAAGGFDETFFYGYEDTDLGWRLRMRGRRVVVAPDLIARHHVEAAPGDAHPEIVFHANKNRLRMTLRNAEGRRLAWVMAGTLGYLVVDLLLHAPRSPKWAAVLWNVRQLRGTLAMRKTTQAQRTVGDGAVFACGAQRWFPPSRLRGRRRRPIGTASTADPLDATRRPRTDDRV